MGSAAAFFSQFGSLLCLFLLFAYAFVFHQALLCTTYVSALSAPARCLKLWMPRASRCAYGGRLCRLRTSMFQTLRRVFVGWKGPDVSSKRRRGALRRVPASGQAHVLLARWRWAWRVHATLLHSELSAASLRSASSQAAARDCAGRCHRCAGCTSVKASCF